MLLLGVAIFCADFAFQSPVTTHRAALIFRTSLVQATLSVSRASGEILRVEWLANSLPTD